MMTNNYKVELTKEQEQIINSAYSVWIEKELDESLKRSEQRERKILNEIERLREIGFVQGVHFDAENNDWDKDNYEYDMPVLLTGVEDTEDYESRYPAVLRIEGIVTPRIDYITKTEWSRRYSNNAHVGLIVYQYDSKEERLFKGLLSYDINDKGNVKCYSITEQDRYYKPEKIRIELENKRRAVHRRYKLESERAIYISNKMLDLSMRYPNAKITKCFSYRTNDNQIRVEFKNESSIDITISAYYNESGGIYYKEYIQKYYDAEVSQASLDGLLEIFSKQNK